MGSTLCAVVCWLVQNRESAGARSDFGLEYIYVEEPCFVLDPEGERLQNRHPDRVGRVKTAFLEEEDDA